jgi:hypothetical protein
LFLKNLEKIINILKYASSELNATKQKRCCYYEIKDQLSEIKWKEFTTNNVK